jgi:predicted ArsR family transcriptional regulator
VEQQDLTQQIAGIAALDEPVRRELYEYVAGQGHPVGRDEAAAALGIGRSLAAFHLDRLVDEQLLEAEYRRLTDRRGPGAGRPAKLYRRSDRQVEISLPPRTYELAARLFASTLESLGDGPALTHLDDAARRFGADVAAQTQAAAGPRASSEARRQQIEEALTAAGYEPCVEDDGTIRLRNCPFHNLAESHRQLVCGMNLSLIGGLVDGLGLEETEAILDPRPGMCCVALRPAEKQTGSQ